MIIIGLLIGISLSIAILFLIAFIWSLKSGQYNDTYGPSVRVLFDDKPSQVKKTSQESNSDFVNDQGINS